MKKARNIEKLAICFILSSLFSPICLAIRTFTPMESPEETVTINATVSVFVPTAASAFELSKYPTRAVSAALKSC